MFKKKIKKKSLKEKQCNTTLKINQPKKNFIKIEESCKMQISIALNKKYKDLKFKIKFNKYFNKHSMHNLVKILNNQINIKIIKMHFGKKRSF